MTYKSGFWFIFRLVASSLLMMPRVMREQDDLMGSFFVSKTSSMYSAIVASEGLGADQSIFALIIIHNGVTKDLEYISPALPLFYDTWDAKLSIFSWFSPIQTKNSGNYEALILYRST